MKTSSHGITSQQLNSFKKLISTANNIAVCSHENPDADAYGSSAGIGLALRAIGKNVFFLSSSQALERYKFLPTVTETLACLPSGFNADLLIVCDCGSFSRIGDSLQQQFPESARPAVLNIDHHISNDSFGTENIVICEASSTSEIICALLQEAQLPISSESASALYAGIMSDSGSFRYSCVRPYTYEAAAACVSNGALPYKISEKLFSNNSLAQVKLHSTALMQMSLHVSSKVALIVTSKEMIANCNASIADSEGLAEQGRDIQGVIVSILMKEDHLPEADSNNASDSTSLWRVSLRSKSEKVDLSALAQQFGGGGHKAAAAFRSRKSKQEIIDKLLLELNHLLDEIT